MTASRATRLLMLVSLAAALVSWPRAAFAQPRGKAPARVDPRAAARARYMDALPAVDRVEIMVLGRRQFQDPDAPVEDALGLPGGDKKPAVDAGAPPGPLAPKGFPIRPYNEFATVTQHASVTGADAENVARLWRALAFSGATAKPCHKPAHGLRFWSGTTLLLETSVSWDCRNFSMPDLGTHQMHGFDPDDANAVALLTELLRLLPPSPAR